MGCSLMILVGCELFTKTPVWHLKSFYKKIDLFQSTTENLQKLATEMYKIKNNYSPVMTKSIFPESINPYNLRSNNPFQSDNVHSVLNGTETLSYRGPKTWLKVPEDRHTTDKFTNRIQKKN